MLTILGYGSYLQAMEAILNQKLSWTSYKKPP